jgi:hypothetical protein
VLQLVDKQRFSTKEVRRVADRKPKPTMEHLNIAEFNRGQSSRLLKELVTTDKTAYIQKNGKPIAVVMSYERYLRLCGKGVDINEY